MKRNDKEKKDMKKFTFKGVLDGFRSSVSQPMRQDLQEIQETLRPEQFDVKKTFLNGFPFEPTAIAYDPIQKILAIGSKNGGLRLLGRPGVDVYVRHEASAQLQAAASAIPGMEGPPARLSSGAVILLEFLVNEGALISATSDDTLHMWSFRQKVPKVVQSLKFQREHITCIHLPLKSRWLYVGSEKGNVHILNIDTFQLSGYIINWNKAIELSSNTHPGAVLHLSDNTVDHSKLLIGFETGLITMWDLKNKSTEFRWQSSEPLRSIAWHYEGKQFVSSHTDGSLVTWTLRNPRPINVMYPHAKAARDGKLEACRPIHTVDWKFSKAGEPYVIFSGGMPNDKSGRSPSITVVHNKTTTVLEMEHNVIDFISLCDSPWPSDMQEPYAIIALLQNDLVIIDLLSPGFPCIENPYPMDIQESAVTCCSYLVDCPADLIPAFYSVGSHNRGGFSKREWPVQGGEWSPQSCSYSEIILTGHADGSIKFWDASAGTLQILYKLKTAKVFDKPRVHSVDDNDDPFAVQHISFCPESRKLCVAGSSYVILFKFKKNDTCADTTILEIPVIQENVDNEEYSPSEFDCSNSATPNLTGSYPNLDEIKSTSPLLRVKQGAVKKPPGFQAQLACMVTVSVGQGTPNITALAINSSYGLMAYGTNNGIVIVDIVQKTVVLNMLTQDLYGSPDAFGRAPKSPKKGVAPDGLVAESAQARSPSIDQVVNLACSPVESSVNPTPLATSPGPDNPLDALESAEEVAAATTAPACARRKSVAWKGMNLKRQLSRVDIKLKSAFSSLDRKSKLADDAIATATFYDASEAVDASPAVRSVSPIETTLEEANGSGELPINAQYDETDTRQFTHHGDQEPDLSRPDNLDLIDEEGRPIRPPRVGKKNKMAANKRNERLLSVPNIKYNKQRDGGRAESGSRDAKFAGNIIRHFRSESVKIPTNDVEKPRRHSVVTSLVDFIKDKLDSSFSRSRSSSMSSLENISTESATCIAFGDCYYKKAEPTISVPALWVGTSTGSVVTILCNGPDPDFRTSQPYTVSPCGGPIFRLKGSVLNISFLDCFGALIPYSYETWRDDSRDRTPTKTNRMSPTMNESRPSSTDSLVERQFVVMVSEKQARVVAMPTQLCLYRQQICDTDFVVKAEVISFKESVCLICYISTGRLLIYTLPSLRILIDVDFLPLSDMSFQTQCRQGIVDPMLSIWGQQIIVNEDTYQIAKTFCFGNRGHGLYLASPSEVQRFTISAEFCAGLSEMTGELFTKDVEMPEPPKENFFRGWFKGTVRSFERDELFGELSGKPSKAVAKVLSGPNAALQDANIRATTATSEISRAHQMMQERGEKLGQLEERTQKMMNEADAFAGASHQLMQKYKDKKWYQL